MNGSVAHEIVEKAGVDRRADAQLDVREKFQHRRGEQMRRRVAQHLNRFGIFRRQDREPHVLIDRRAQIDQKTFAVRRGSQPRFGRRIGRFFSHRTRGRARGGRPVDRSDPRDQRFLGQPRRNLLRDLRRRGAERHFADRAVRHRNVNGIHNV